MLTAQEEQWRPLRVKIMDDLWIPAFAGMTEDFFLKMLNIVFTY
jgi:hypothetical protein